MEYVSIILIGVYIFLTGICEYYSDWGIYFLDCENCSGWDIFFPEWNMYIFLICLVSELIIRHGNETKFGDKEDNFLENLLNISNVLMMDSLPWKEISNDSVRYQASSNIGNK